MTSCADLKPLYKNDNISNIPGGNVKILPVEGRYGVYLKNELDSSYSTTIFGNEDKVFFIESTLGIGESSVQAYNDDGTASRFVINITVSYRVYDEDGCNILTDTNSTNASYNSKSGGYDYGNIASQKAAIEKNIEYNEKQFYPHIYNAITNSKIEKVFVAPYISIDNFKGCVYFES